MTPRFSRVRVAKAISDGFPPFFSDRFPQNLDESWQGIEVPMRMTQPETLPSPTETFTSVRCHSSSVQEYLLDTFEYVVDTLIGNNIFALPP
jgi:hypothetical protein